MHPNLAYRLAHARIDDRLRDARDRRQGAAPVARDEQAAKPHTLRGLRLVRAAVASRQR